MSEIDQQFIEYVVKSLVGKPEAVHIDRRIDEKGVLLELTVDPEDLGRVIGKRGATAQSLRTLLRALGTKNDARYNLKIIDNGTQGPAQAGDSNHVTPAAAPQKPASQPTADDESDYTAPTVTEPAADTSAVAPTETHKVGSETPPASPTGQTLPSSRDEDRTSDRLKKTRAELADLDDLDV